MQVLADACERLQVIAGACKQTLQPVMGFKGPVPGLDLGSTQPSALCQNGSDTYLIVQHLHQVGLIGVFVEQFWYDKVIISD